MSLYVKFVVLLLVYSWFTDSVLSQSVVENLPGFPGKLPFSLETGYVGVGESEQVQLFYYFIKSEGNPEKDPLLLWLTGGPGCSAFSGLVYEIGPLTFDYANSHGSTPTLILNPYSWTKVASIIFLDQPAGTGYSYATTHEAFNTSDTLASAHTYQFLKKWLINHPKYLANPLYISGDSYSGITVPLVVNEVYNGIESGSKPLLNIKGYILGNPRTDVYTDVNGRIPYAHRVGLLSDKLYQSAKENCNEYYLGEQLENVLCHDDLQRVYGCLHEICKAHILEPWCNSEGNAKRDVLALPTPVSEDSWCREDNYRYSYIWANNKSIQNALYVREGTIKEWVRCNSSIKYRFDLNRSASYTFDVKSSLDYHKKFTNKDCRALIYSGDHDMVVPHTTTEEWINSLKLLVQSDWRPWFVEGQIAGYTTAYVHGDYDLTYATVKGAGHTGPEYKPRECLSMLVRWLGHAPL